MQWNCIFVQKDLTQALNQLHTQLRLMTSVCVRATLE